MAVDTSDKQALLTRYVDDLNGITKTREFAPFVKQWFALPDCELTMHHQVEGIEGARIIWKHFLPVGGDTPREVLQFVYKVEGNRVLAWRQLQGGNAPKPLYGMQETRFDDRSLISEIVIHSVQDKPEVDTDPRAASTRFGRLFLEFADVFNDFFVTGDTEPIEEWCSPDVRMVIDSAFHGMGVVAPHNRINENAHFTLREFAQQPDGTIKATVDFENWGGIDGSMPWEIEFDANGKVRHLGLTLSV